MREFLGGWCFHEGTALFFVTGGIAGVQQAVAASGHRVYGVLGQFIGELVVTPSALFEKRYVRDIPRPA